MPEMTTLDAIIQRLLSKQIAHSLYLGTRIPLQISLYFNICSSTTAALLMANELGGVVAYLQRVLLTLYFFRIKIQSAGIGKTNYLAFYSFPSRQHNFDKLVLPFLQELLLDFFQFTILSSFSEL